MNLKQRSLVYALANHASHLICLKNHAFLANSKHCFVLVRRKTYYKDLIISFVFGKNCDKKKRERSPPRMKRTKYPQLTDLIRRVINIAKLNGALTKVVVLLFCWAESVEQSNNCRNRPHYHFQKCDKAFC